MIAKEAAFHSKTEVNLESNNSNESIRVTFIVHADFESSTPSYQHANQTPKRATPIGIIHTFPDDFSTT